MSDSQISRRRWLGGMTATAATAAASLLSTPGRAQAATIASLSPTGVLDTEVVVVGGGYSGLACARALKKAGRQVLLLEARNRPGGRCVNQSLPSPYQRFTVEGGAAFIGPGQTRMNELVREFGFTAFRTYNTGKLVNYTNGVRTTYSGVIPTFDLLAAAESGIALLRLDGYAKQVPVDAPWQATRALEWDNMTVQTWMDKNIINKAAKELMRLALLSILSCEPRDVSLLYFLHYISTAGGTSALLSTEGGAQQDRIDGGSQVIAKALATTLGDRIVYDAAVTNIEQDASGIMVSGTDFTVRAKHAVMAMSPWMAGRVSYDGVLAPALQTRLQMMQRMPMGSIIKVHCLYDRPFWRDAQLNGQVTSDAFITKVTFDDTPLGLGAPGVMMGFINGQDAIASLAMTPAERRRKVLEAFTTYFGPKAANPIGYLEMNWQAENYSGGGPTGYFPPGVLTTFGPALRKPVGLLHWAGTETSTAWTGFMEGAVRAGERAAQDILAVL